MRHTRRFARNGMSTLGGEAVVISRRFQKLKSYHFNRQIKCVAPLGTEAVAAHYTKGTEHIISVYSSSSNNHRRAKASVEKSVERFLYIKKFRVYVMFCADLTLRVYTEIFQLLQSIPLSSTAFCMKFVDTSSTLYVGTSGFVKAWHLSDQLYSPLVPLSEATITVGRDKWVVHLDYEAKSQRLSAVTEDCVSVIDTKLNKKIASYSVKYDGRPSLAGALLFSSLDYLVLAFLDGHLMVHNTVLDSTVKELPGHQKIITGLERCVDMDEYGFISCSLDGTVRVWNLNTLLECNRLNLGYEVLGMSLSCHGDSETVQLLCHSHQDISTWHLSKMESHFASVYSDTVSLNRVPEISRCLSRIIATGEDGSVRILCPTSGTIITTFFPIFTTEMLRETVYCGLGGLLFALLDSGSVMVVSARTNPCSTLMLWTSSSQRESILSICICTVELNGKSQSLVFGGSACGHILLLHSFHVAMELPCPAHGGPVIKLVSSSSLAPVVPQSSSPHTASLVSLGADNFLNVWSMSLNKDGDRVELNMVVCIHMDQLPLHISLLDSLLCITTFKNTVEMVDISAKVMSTPYSLPQSYFFRNLPVLAHQQEDRHRDTITTLCCSPELRLFATSSLDGTVKVWSSSNHLVAEIDFGGEPMSVCFSNSRGDLLVGFQSHLCSINASQYLSHSSTTTSSVNSPSPKLSQVEPIPFNSNLKFWYDPERVPSYPVQQSLRKEQCENNLLDQYYYTSPLPSQTVLKSTQNTDFVERRIKPSLRSPSLRVELLRRSSVSLVASVVMESGSAVVEQKSSLSCLREAVMSGIGAMRSDELVRTLVKEKEKKSQSVPSQRLTQKGLRAEVTPLKGPPSLRHSIAPDCLVPNSTVREKIGYVAAPDPLSLIRQSAIDLLLAPTTSLPPPLSSHQLRREKRERRRRRKKRAVDTEGDCAESTMPVGESEDSLSECSNYTSTFEAEINEDGVKSSAPSPVTISATSSLYYLRENSSFFELAATPETHLLEEKLASFEKVLSPTKEVEINETELVMTEMATPPQSVAAKAVEKSGPPETDRGPEKMENETLSDLVKSGIAMKASKSLVAQTVAVLPTVTIPLELGPPKTTRTVVKPKPLQPVPLDLRHNIRINHGPTTSGPDVPRTGPSEERRVGEEEEDDGVRESSLQKIMKLVHFSPDQPLSTSTIGILCNEMVSMLNSVSDGETVRDITNAIEEIRLDTGLNGEQLAGISEALTRLLTEEDLNSSSISRSSTIQAVLQGLRQLGPVTGPSHNARKTQLAILPYLMNTNVGVREAAFGALDSVTGITRRSELHHSLIEMGFLQHIISDENEVLRALAERLEKRGVVKPRRPLNPDRVSHQFIRAGKHSKSEKVTVKPLPNERVMRRNGNGVKRRVNEKKKQLSGVKKTSSVDKMTDSEENEREEVKEIVKESEKELTTEEVADEEDRGECEPQEPLIKKVPTVNGDDWREGGSVKEEDKRRRRRPLNKLLSRADAAMMCHRLHYQHTLLPIPIPIPPQSVSLKRTNQTGASSFYTSYHYTRPSELKTRNWRLHKLLATRPLMFYHRTPIRELMAGVYPAGRGRGGARGRGGGRKERERFHWTHIHPVLLNTSSQRNEKPWPSGLQNGGPEQTRIINQEDIELLKLPKI